MRDEFVLNMNRNSYLQTGRNRENETPIHERMDGVYLKFAYLTLTPDTNPFKLAYGLREGNVDGLFGRTFVYIYHLSCYDWALFKKVGKSLSDLVVYNCSDLVKVFAAPVVGQRTYRDARGPIYDVFIADVRQAGHVDWPGPSSANETSIPKPSEYL